MKLVDILAREMKAWPDEVFTITQDDDGKLNGNESDYPPVLRGITWVGGAFYLDSPINVSECFIVAVSHDWTTSIVTRAEWQAAVDALNAPKVVKWDGVSIPSPGDSLEYKTTDAGEYWCKSIVKFVGTHFLLVGYQHPELGLSEAGINHAMLDGNFSGLLRKIRTAEQVAAEEREKAVDGLVELFVNHYEYPKGAEQYLPICRAIHDAGYRKEPNPCGS